MNIKIVIWPWVFKLPGMKSYGGIVIGRLIIFSSEKMKSKLLEHEMIHQDQMDRLTVPGFYMAYLYHFIFGLFKHGNWRKAYRQNPLEREAYGDEE